MIRTLILTIVAGIAIVSLAGGAAGALAVRRVLEPRYRNREPIAGHAATDVGVEP